MNTLQPSLRSDLTSVRCGSDVRPYRIVFDGISGRYARISERLWNSLQQGVADASTWRQAHAAGWIRSRTLKRGIEFNPLYVRVPLLSIDRIASLLARYSGFVFSVWAIRFWSLLMCAALLTVVVNFPQLMLMFSELPQFLAQANPWCIGGIFLATKLTHELAHAVACRRVGASCGKIGILLLCGVPCPFCDVTGLWRIPSARHRAAVMMAGIYVELILASVAAIVWTMSNDRGLQFHAMNVMLLCSVSTLLFNANPLMRYDGYYVLADLLGSVHLRAEAREAWGRLVNGRPGRSFLSSLRMADRRCYGLALYHWMSTVYRILVLLMIATLIVVFAKAWYLESLARITLFVFGALLLAKGVRPLTGLLLGTGPWRTTTIPKRILLSGAALGSVGLLLFVPLPRTCRVSGYIDAADALEVFLASQGVVDEVRFDVGETVHESDLLVRVRSDEGELNLVEQEGRFRVASLRLHAVRRDTIENNQTHGRWETLHRIQDAVRANLTSTRQQVDQNLVRSPISGIVIPPTSSIAHNRNAADTQSNPLSYRLSEATGIRSDPGMPWCRVSPSGRLFAVLQVNATERAHIRIGQAIRVRPGPEADQVVACHVESVSAVRQDDVDVTRHAYFDVLCPLPDDLNVLTIQGGDSDLFLSRLGSHCDGVIDLPRRSLATDVWLFVRGNLL